MSSRKCQELIESLTREVRKFIAGAVLFNLKVAEGLGVNGTDLQCLHVLELQGSATPGELARWTRLTTGGITVVLDRLEKAGYVERGLNPADRRSSIVRPVQAQLGRLRKVYRSKSEGLVDVLAEYDEEDLRLILDFFSKANSRSA
ncbi:MAG: MarR family winged helix-turn-helix transcriptional regulator [Terriglobia bacterium]